MDKKSLILQLERLYRHYLVSIKTYDRISLLDLSHSLRIWTEYKDTVNIENFKNANNALFRYSSPPKQLKRASNNSNYFWFGIPGGAGTYAHKGNLMFSPEAGKTTMGVNAMNDTEGRLWISQGHWFSTNIEEHYITSKTLAKEQIQKAKYSYWLGTESIRLSFFNETILTSISKEVLIKRVANTLDGSHPARNNTDDNNNRYDRYVKKLMDFTCGGLPIPYFLLIGMAKEILAKMPKILETEEYQII